MRPLHAVWAPGARSLRLGMILMLSVLTQPLGSAAAAAETDNPPTVRGRLIATADPRVLQQARELLAVKRADASEQAYQLLAPHEYDWAGDRDFDYLLGAAAVDTGRNSEAVLSLQRSLATDPDYSAARMELARAYYNLGDYEYAKAEFRTLLTENPPDYARRVINNYLQAIEKRDAPSGGPKFQYFVEFDFGYDTNANGSTKDDTFGVFTLREENVEQDSFFVGFAHGGVWTNPLSQRLTNYNSFGFNHRRNFSASFVNWDRLLATTSLAYRQGGTTLSGGLNAYLYYLDNSFFPFTGDENSQGVSLDLGARQALSDQFRLGLDLRHGQVRYADELEVRDVDQTLYAVSLDYSVPGPDKASVSVSLTGGEEDARDSTSPFGRDLSGARANFSWLMSPIARSYLFASVQDSDYDGQFFDGAVLTSREDQFVSFGWYLIWRVFSNQNWALVPRVVYTKNDSDISLYEYDRMEIGLAIRWLAD